MSVEPDVRRKFQLTNLHSNQNKYWLIGFWESSGHCRVVYGRVGAEVVEESRRNRSYVEQKIREKTRKGYAEIDLPVVKLSASPSPSQLHPKVSELIGWIFQEAGERIAQYLATGLEALSQQQIDRGRSVLLEAQQARQSGAKAALLEAIQRYYNLIPTQLPRKIDPTALVEQFDFAEQDTRLNQLEAALSTQTVSHDVDDRYRLLGAAINHLDTSSTVHQSIAEYIERTGAGVRRIRDIFSVAIPHERSAWEGCSAGKHYVVSMFHGTRNPNVRHILKKGLIIPQIAANGSRFGRGIYFADQARRSFNYTGSSSHIPRMMFVADVALGTPCTLSGDNPALTQAPDGYDSVWGVQSYSGMDEFIIYRPAQQTIRAVVTLD